MFSDAGDEGNQAMSPGTVFGMCVSFLSTASRFVLLLFRLSVGLEPSCSFGLLS